jgi:hypothetical protein
MKYRGKPQKSFYVQQSTFTSSQSLETVLLNHQESGIFPSAERNILKVSKTGSIN